MSPYKLHINIVSDTITLIQINKILILNMGLIRKQEDWNHDLY